MLIALAVSALLSQPPSPPSALVGPPTPFKRLDPSATVWVFARVLPEAEVSTTSDPASWVGQLSRSLRAAPVLRSPKVVDPVSLIPGPRYGGNPLPKMYSLGAPVHWGW